MTASNNSYRIRNFVPAASASLNTEFAVDKSVFISGSNQSTLFKDGDSISITNRIEIQRVRSFSELGNNWDSYEALEVSKDAISQAVDLIVEIDKLEEDVYFSSPGPNGEVMLLLKKKDKELEIIVYAEKMKYVSFENGEFEQQGAFNSQILPDTIAWLNF